MTQEFRRSFLDHFCSKMSQRSQCKARNVQISERVDFPIKNRVIVAIGDRYLIVPIRGQFLPIHAQ
jgi:hypothetical protein